MTCWIFRARRTSRALNACIRGVQQCSLATLLKLPCREQLGSTPFAQNLAHQPQSFDGRMSAAASRLLMDRYTRGRRTFMTATRDSSASSSLDMAKPCIGFSQMMVSTMWSSTDGVYSLTVTILAKARSLVVVLPIFVVAVTTPVHAESVETKKVTITVSAAASLAKSYGEIGKQFEKANPSIKVRFNFASSSSLVSQIQSGAPTDVFAAAELTSFDKLLASGNVVKSPKVFARNSMQLVVKPVQSRWAFRQLRICRRHRLFRCVQRLRHAACTRQQCCRDMAW